MCGRYAHRLTYRQIVELYRITEPDIGSERELRLRYNAALTNVMPVCRLDRQGRRETAMLKWKLIPFWAKDPKIAL